MMASGALHAAQQSLAASDEFARRERLGHVIVGARAKSHDLIRFGIAGGKHQHRDRTFGDDAFRRFDAIHNGQHDVHDD